VLIGGGVLVLTAAAAIAGAIAFAHTLATHQPPQAADLRRLADYPAANVALKTDRLAVTLAALTPADPPAAVAPAPEAPTGALPYAPAAALEKGALDRATLDKAAQDRAALDKAALDKAAKAKAAAKPPKPSNILLNDAQIAALKQRLRLTASQEALWPEIELALRGVLVQIQEAHRKAKGASVPLDVNTPEVERLKTAALPFLMQMRPDQKAEIISLTRIIGLEKMVASL
jgi:hypothetical protein